MLDRSVSFRPADIMSRLFAGQCALLVMHTARCTAMCNNSKCKRRQAINAEAAADPESSLTEPFASKV